MTLSTGDGWAVGQAASMSVTCKKPQRTLKTKGAMMTMTMMKVMRLVAPRRGMFGGRFKWGIGNGSLLKLAVLPLFSDFSNVYPP